jgi:transaldolase
VKFFLDTAMVDEIRAVADMGLLDGVTTNPTLAAKTGRSFKEVVTEICSICDGPVSAESVSLDTEGILAEAHEITSWAPNVVVKIPMMPAGMKAVRILSEEGIKTNVTLCFSPTQALVAAKAGATFISPFVGRLDDIATTGMDLIREIAQIFDNYAFDTEIIVASARGPQHVRESALIGADIVTMPYDTFTKLFQHPLTDNGIAKFLADWEKAGLKIG